MGLFRNIFSWFGGRKASPIAGLTVQTGTGSAAWSNRDYETFAREAYQKNVIAYRSINTIVRALAAIPWYVLVGGKEVEDDYPLVELLYRPNAQAGTGRFIETIGGFYLIAGNSYIVRVPYEGAGSRRAPLELYTLRPDRTQVYKKKNGDIDYYEYTVGTTKQQFHPIRMGGSIMQTVLHLKTFNPTDDTYGLSPIEAAAFSVDQHNAAGEWNYKLLKNGARPSGAMKYESTSGVPMTEPQFARIKKEMKTQYQGPANAGTPMLLEGGLSWQQMALSPQDMDWLNGKNVSAREIATTFGVAPMLVGIVGDATYANYKEARIALYEETVIPIARYIRDELNVWLAPWYGEDVEIAVDEDQIPAIAEKRLSMATQLSTAKFLTINEKRAAMGYEELDYGDVILVSGMEIPLEELTAEPDEPAVPPPTPEDDDELEEELEAVENDVDKAIEVAYGSK